VLEEVESWPMSITVSPALPDVLALPGSLTLNLPKGEITTASLTLRNQGLAPALGVQVLLPCIPNPGVPCPAGNLISLLGPSQVGDLQPGESKVVELSFGPSSFLDVGTTASGTIVLTAANDDVPDVPLHLTIVGSALGEVRVKPKDEASYFDGLGNACLGNCPLVANATGRLFNPYVPGADYTAIAVGGELWFPGTVEGTYYLEVKAPLHATWTSIVEVQGSQVLDLTVFMPIQAVSYSFTVEETEIPDEYAIVVEADYVVPTPAPKIVVTPNLFDLEIGVGAVVQVDMDVWNSGLIIAEGLELYMDDLPSYVVTPAYTVIGDLGPDQRVIVPVTIQRLGRANPCDMSIKWGLRHALSLVDDPTLPSEEQTTNVAWYWTPLFYAIPQGACGLVPPTGGTPPKDLPPPSSPPPSYDPGSGSSGSSGGAGGGFGGGGGGGGAGGGSPSNPVIDPPPSLELPEPCPGN
jgi:uncharacterized membrane protein YgcG